MNATITNDTRTVLMEAFDRYRAEYERCYAAGCRRIDANEAEFKTALADYHAALEDAKSEIRETTE